MTSDLSFRSIAGYFPMNIVEENCWIKRFCCSCLFQCEQPNRLGCRIAILNDKTAPPLQVNVTTSKSNRIAIQAKWSQWLLAVAVLDIATRLLNLSVILQPVEF